MSNKIEEQADQRIHKLVKHQLREARRTDKTMTELMRPIKHQLSKQKEDWEKEARIDENLQPLVLNIDDAYSSHYKNGFQMAVQQVVKAREARIAHLSSKETNDG